MIGIMTNTRKVEKDGTSGRIVPSSIPKTSSLCSLKSSVESRVETIQKIRLEKRVACPSFFSVEMRPFQKCRHAMFNLLIFSQQQRPMTAGKFSGTTTTMESSQPNTSNDDEISQLKQSLEEVKEELSEAKEKIARLEAENAELRRRAELGVGNKNGQADTGEQGVLNSQNTAADSSGGEMKSNADGNEERKDDDTPGNEGMASGMKESEEANAAHEAQQITPQEGDENNDEAKEDADEPNGRSDGIDGDGESVESSHGGESESDDDADDEEDRDEQQQQQQEPPTSPADDIRLRAARTLIWADSAINDVADRLVAMDTSDNRSLHSGSLAGGGASGGLPPRSPPGNYKYCNDAMKKKMGGDDDASTRTPTSVRSGGDGDGNGSEAKPKPMMNEAMMRLSSEKKKRTGFGSRLFNG